MSKAVEARIMMMDGVIERHKEMLNTRVMNYKKKIAEAGTEYIVNYAKDGVEEIERLYEELIEYAKEKEVLEWALAQEEA